MKRWTNRNPRPAKNGPQTFFARAAAGKPGTVSWLLGRDQERKLARKVDRKARAEARSKRLNELARLRDAEGKVHRLHQHLKGKKTGAAAAQPQAVNRLRRVGYAIRRMLRGF
jgi:hypothetical protein